MPPVYAQKPNVSGMPETPSVSQHDGWFLTGLKRENLRDHMNDLELIFSMLGERVSTEITRKEDAQGYPEVEDAAKRGGRVAGNARADAEKELGRPITSNENYLSEQEKKKKLEDKKQSLSPFKAD